MNNESEMKTVVWIFGRGASVACGLEWREPAEWQSLNRDIRIERVKEALRAEIQKIPTGITPYQKLLSVLEKSASQNWKHLFITTNWDFLFEREILSKKFKGLPNWLMSSHVFHLNGSIEEGPQNNRSPFLFESDTYHTRKSSFEVNQAMSYLIWERLFVVVGVSFSCQTDKALLVYLQHHEDKLPFGEGKWLIINPNQGDLGNVTASFRKTMPAANILSINKTFQDWIEGDMIDFLNHRDFEEVS